MAKKVENKDLFADDLFKSTVKDVELLIAELDKLEKSIVEVAKAQKTILNQADTKSIEGIRATNESIKKLSETEKMHLKLQQDKLTLETKLKAARTNQAQQNAELSVLTQQQNRINKQAVLENEKLNGSYAAQSARLNRLRKEYKDLAASKGTTSLKAKELIKEITHLDTKLKGIDKTVGQSQRNVGNYGSAFDKLGGTLRTGLGFLGITSGIALVTGALTNAFNIINGFSQSIADLGALTGTSGEELKGFEKSVLNVSKNTGKGATEIAKAFAIVGGAQPELLKSADALGAVTQAAVLLSKAGNIEVPDAAQSVALAMNQFGASANEAAKYVDILATSQQKGTATIPQLSESLKNVGSVARASGLDFEKTNVLLQALAKGGIIGAEAGTKLRGVLLKLAETGRKELNPATNDFNDILKTLETEITDVTKAQKMFGTENAAAALTLINQKKVVDELTGALNVNGAALEQANQRFDTFAGASEKLTTNWELFILSLDNGDGVISRVFTNATKSISNFLEKLTELNKTSKELIEDLQKNTASKFIKDLEEQVSQNINLRKKEVDEEIKILESRKNRGIISEKSYNNQVLKLRSDLEKETSTIRNKTIINEIKSLEQSIALLEKEEKYITKNANKILETQTKLGKLEGFGLSGLTPNVIKQQQKLANIYVTQKSNLEELRRVLNQKNELEEQSTEENTTATDKNNKSKEKKIKLDKYIVDKSFEQQDALDKENQAKLDAYEKEQKEMEKLRLAQGEYEDYLLKQYKTDEEGFKLKEQQRKELTEATLEVISTMLEEYHKRELEAIDKQIAATEKRVDQLRKKAELGQLASEESLAFEEKKQAELEQKRLQMQKRQQREQALFTVISTYQSKIAAGDKSPLLSTIKDIAVLKSFASTLAGFYEGTDDVGKSLGKPQLSGKDGHIVRVDGKEQIWSAKDRAAVGFRSRDEIKDLVGLVDNGLINNITNREIFNPNSFVLNGLMDKKVLSKLDGIEKAIAKIDIPEGMVDIDQVRGLINLYSQKSNKKTIERSKLFN